MDRTPEPNPSSADALPPFSEKTLLTLQGSCLAACLLTVIPAPFGGVSPGLFSSTILLVLSIALPLCAYALSQRPADWRCWALASAAAWAASFGLPRHWDDAAMVCRVFGVALAVGTALCWARPAVRYGAISLMLLYHFSAIFNATNSPEPTPWMTVQLSQRVYVPYYRFCYLSNAYHFYSPEPGPASLLYFLITYELDETDPTTNKPKLESAWLDLPNRETQFKDPLGMTYQRRLSITELVAQGSPGSLTADNFERNEVANRRRAVAVNVERPGERIPFLPTESPATQYRIPNPQAQRYLLPAYARHIATAYAAPPSGKAGRVVSVKIVRVEHRVTPPQAFLHQVDPETGARREEGENPYNPPTYRPYYLGEYNPAGELMNPTDPMLYWLLPIIQRSSQNEQGRFYDDYMSKYLKHEFPWTGGVK